jgi:hypothetical protein
MNLTLRSVSDGFERFEIAINFFAHFFKSRGVFSFQISHCPIEFGHEPFELLTNQIVGGFTSAQRKFRLEVFLYRPALGITDIVGHPAKGVYPPGREFPGGQILVLPASGGIIRKTVGTCARKPPLDVIAYR